MSSEYYDIGIPTTYDTLSRSHILYIYIYIYIYI